MIAILITQPAAFVACLYLVLRHLQASDTARRAETDWLIQRIQAPEQAIHQYGPQPEPQDPFPLDDEATVTAMDKELAEALAQAEEIENELVL